MDLPLMGKEMDQGKAGWGLKPRENLADVLSPINGVIMEVNGTLREDPGKADPEPDAGGWLFVVHNPDIKGTMTNLMTDRDTLDWMSAEVSQLEGMIEEASGPLSVDGGYLREDIFGNFPQLGWNRLTKTFLRS